MAYPGVQLAVGRREIRARISLIYFRNTRPLQSVMGYTLRDRVQSILILRNPLAQPCSIVQQRCFPGSIFWFQSIYGRQYYVPGGAGSNKMLCVDRELTQGGSEPNDGQICASGDRSAA